MRKIITLFAFFIFSVVCLKSNAQCSLTDNPTFSNAAGTSSFCQGAVVQFVVTANVTDNSSNSFSYVWNTGGTNDTIVVPASALVAGTYTYCCSVTDGLFCNTYDCVTLTVNSLPTLSITASGPVCFGQPILLTDNIVDASTSTMAAYAWSPSASTSDTAEVITNANITELAQVEDINGCISNIASINLTPDTPPVVTVTPAMDTICIGGLAALQANVTYNSTTSFSYSWTDGGLTDTAYISPDASQWETVTFTDGNGCWDTASSFVSVDDISGNFTINPNPICIGSWSTIGLNLISALNLPLTYAWSTGGTNDTIKVSPTTASTYTVGISDQYCYAGGTSPVLEVHGLPSALINNPSPTCEYTNTTLTATVTDTASSSFMYAWSNSSTSDTADVTPPMNTIYTLVVTDGHGCTDTTLTLVQIFGLPIVTFPTIGFGNPVCQGNTALPITGGSPAGGIYSGANVSGGMFTPSAIGSNVILYTYTNMHGCSDTASFDVLVSTCTGVNEMNASNAFYIYPNPSQDNIYVKFNSSDFGNSALISITDVTGRVISENMNTVGNELIKRINVSELPAGMYFIKITTANATQTYKFVKE